MNMTKKKVGIITFHASHNYGSMLQAYALQQTILNLGYKCEIINFRSKRQKDAFKPPYMQGSVCERVKRLLIQLAYITQINKKYFYFEQFIRDNLHLSSKEYETLDDLTASPPLYDYYISGSDQIWNPQCFDFDLAYYLPFVKSGKRIAYAPSMGPNPEIQSFADNTSIRILLNKYNAIGVREPRTARYIETLLNKSVDVVLDPTLLLSSSQWEAMIDSKPIIDGDYIFLYSPKFNSFESTYALAERISQKYKLKVVLSRAPYYFCDAKRWKNFKVHSDVGPKEFLNLCKYARLVCCDSFHAVVFSILLKKPFVVMDGLDDSRISTILKLACLEHHSFNKSTLIDDRIFIQDFDDVQRLLHPSIKSSINFLIRNLS